MIVCAGGSIYDFAINKLYPQEELITIEGHQEMRLHTPTGTLIFFSYHPSVIKSPRDFPALHEEPSLKEKKITWQMQ